MGPPICLVQAQSEMRILETVPPSPRPRAGCAGRWYSLSGQGEWASLQNEANQAWKEARPLHGEARDREPPHGHTRMHFRDMQGLVPKLGLPWDGEPDPDHSTIHRAYGPPTRVPRRHARQDRRALHPGGWLEERAA